MAIELSTGDLMAANVEALVNTVNTVGVMGKGIALQFRRRYPEMFAEYQRAVKGGEVEIGKMHVWPTGQLSGPKYIINFPTKKHWRSPSRIEYVAEGLRDFTAVIDNLGIKSVALPPLGCGNGGLDWAVVEPIIRSGLAPIAESVNVHIYPPAATPPAANMKTSEKKPNMTEGRAALVAILNRYKEQSLEDATLIESQKLMYFLQEAGQPLKLKFAANLYGPYADNLRHVLRVVESHYLSGYGDGSQTVLTAEPLEVLPGAQAAAMTVLNKNPIALERIERVMALTEGFETPYGLELLASVHWVMRHDQQALADPQVAVEHVRNWTKRKARMFAPTHIQAAWNKLNHQGWATAGAFTT